MVKIMVRKGFLWILMLSFSAGCGIINITKSGSSSDRYRDYNEDLGSSRVTFPELPELDLSTSTAEVSHAGAGAAVDNDLQEALAHFADAKSEEPYFSGFTIMVYSGVDRDEAFKTRNDLYSSIPDITANMQYQQPRYLVKVGEYVNRIEALLLYEKIKEKFPAARIIQDRFQRQNAGSKRDLENVEN